MRAGRVLVALAVLALSVPVASGCGLLLGLEDHQPYPADGAAPLDATFDVPSPADASDARADGVASDATASDAACTGQACHYVVKLAAGTDHACVVYADGTASCWGSNQFGQIGVDHTGDSTCGGTPCRPSPTVVPGLSNVVDMSLGSSYTCALLRDGSVWCFGRNDNWQLGHAGGDPTCPVQTPTGPVPISCNSTPMKVASLPAANQIAAGDPFACALTKTNEVYCWGDDTYGELAIGGLGAGSSTPQVAVVLSANVSEIAAGLGGPYACAITNGGDMYCWGINSFGALGHDPSTDIPCGAASVCAPAPVLVAKDAADNPFGNVMHIAAGYVTTCAWKHDGSLWCWGGNGLGQVGNGTYNTNTNPLPLGAARPGNVSGLALRFLNPCISLTPSDDMWCWGDVEWGALGNGGITGTGCTGGVPCATTATKVPGLANVVSIAAGVEYELALTTDGRVWSWGANSDGRLGHAPGGSDIQCAGDAGPCNPTPQPIVGLP
jgi:alpha-tubulin suppressor-like RCC1 family protein